MGNGEKPKTQKRSNKGIHFVSAQVPEGATQANSVQAHQVCKEQKSACASKTNSREQLLQDI